MNRNEGFQSIITEIELLALLGIKRTKLDDMRLKMRLPFVRVGSTARVYLEKDVVEWLENHRIILNREQSVSDEFKR